MLLDHTLINSLPPVKQIRAALAWLEIDSRVVTIWLQSNWLEDFGGNQQERRGLHGYHAFDTKYSIRPYRKEDGALLLWTRCLYCFWIKDTFHTAVLMAQSSSAAGSHVCLEKERALLNGISHPHWPLVFKYSHPYCFMYLFVQWIKRNMHGCYAAWVPKQAVWNVRIGDGKDQAWMRHMW